MARSISVLIVFILLNLSYYVISQEQFCSHPIFCNQTILKAVSDSNMFQNDFKQFVDLVLKVPVQAALKSFNQDNIQTFVQNNFVSSDSILEPINLCDYVQKPPQFKSIKDSDLLLFAYDLNKRWNQLARKVNLDFSKEGSCKIQCSTFLETLDNKTLIIPGGRFKQGYYWDSFWIVKGLIASNMLDSAENIVRNFLLILKRYGFIPNGFRKYYLNRSQPPFLTLMVKQVTQALLKQGKIQKADQLQKDSFEFLVSEHDFWQKYKSTKITIKNKQFTVNVYNANTTTPRPQSYRQDAKIVSNITNITQKNRILHCISTMAESGWDFSSRWFKNTNDLLTTAIDQIVPTDLNSIMAMNEAYLIKLSQKFKRQDLQVYYLKCLKQRKQYFSSIKTKSGTYPDYKNFQSKSIYPSDFYPYFINPQNIQIEQFYSDLINPVTSKIPNGQQWDMPNVWAPNNWILHQVLPNKQSFQYAQQWISTVFCSWKNQGLIYQKYRNDKLGVRGQGGEYQVQTGFGWTNGLALYYLMLYPGQLSAPKIQKCNN